MGRHPSVEVEVENPLLGVLIGVNTVGDYHNSVLLGREEMNLAWANFKFCNWVGNFDLKLSFVTFGFNHLEGVDHVLLEASVGSVHEDVVLEELEACNINNFFD